MDIMLNSNFNCPYFRLFQVTQVPDILSLCSSQIYAKKHVEYLKMLALDHNLNAQKFIEYAFAQYKKEFNVDLEIVVFTKSIQEVFVSVISPLRTIEFDLRTP